MKPSHCRIASRAGTVLRCLLRVLLFSTIDAPAQSFGPAGDGEAARAVRFVYPDTARDEYLKRLQREHNLSQLRKDAADGLQTVLAITAWTHSRWKHNGSHEPSRPDALTILREAAAGKNFRCVEYASVSADALLALGMKARVLNLKTKDAAQRKSGAGHVLTEVWLPGYGKWVLADAQFNLVPTLQGKPLNAVELQRAFAGGQRVAFRDASGDVSAGRARKYRNFIARYLYLMDAELDQREVPDAEKHRLGTFSSLMLLPPGAQPPTVFQRRFPLDYMLCTESVDVFYQRPD
jgi:transglutaminase-like putative cysteine protease